MRFNYKVQLIVLGAWIFVVGALFSLVSDKKVASAIAGVGFVLIPLVLLKLQFAIRKRSKFVIFAAVLFLVLSALPIFLLRVLNWDSEFKDLSLLGLSADFLHRSSNILYLVMMLAVVFAAFREKYPKK